MMTPMTDYDPRENKRGKSGHPEGRREEDLDIHVIALQLNRLEHRVNARFRFSAKNLAGVILPISGVASAIVGVVLWLGGSVMGPGAKIEKMQRDQAMKDSITAVRAESDRASILQLVQSLARTQEAQAATIAQLGYDMCIVVYRMEQRECFARYLKENSRLAGSPGGAPTK